MEATASAAANRQNETPHNKPCVRVNTAISVRRDNGWDSPQ